jgi:hypothetical protein
MAVLAGFVAAVVALAASMTVCIFLVELVTGSGPHGFGSAPAPKVAVYFIVGITLASAVMAYRGAHQFVMNRRNQRRGSRMSRP